MGKNERSPYRALQCPLLYVAQDAKERAFTKLLITPLIFVIFIYSIIYFEIIPLCMVYFHYI